MGAGCTSSRPRTIRGVTISKNIELQKFLEGWRDLGVSFVSVSLLAESKDSMEAYDIDKNAWTTQNSCGGQTALVLKTTGDGWLRMHLSMSGFRWDHIGNYRGIGKLDPNGPALKVVETVDKHFQVETLKMWLDSQCRYVYSDEDVSSFTVVNSNGHIGRLTTSNGNNQRNVELVACADFAKTLYKQLTESNPEGTRNNDRAKSAEDSHKTHHERQSKNKPTIPYGYETGSRLAQNPAPQAPQADLTTATGR